MLSPRLFVFLSEITDTNPGSSYIAKENKLALVTSTLFFYILGFSKYLSKSKVNLNALKRFETYS